MAEERTVQSALEVAHIKSTTKVASYFDKVYQTAYASRWNGYVSGILMGSAFGGIIGALAAYVPAIVTGGAIPPLPAVGQSAALFAGLGSVAGTAIGTQVGVTAGAVSAGFEEQARRAELEKIRAQNPELAAKLEKEAREKADALQPKNVVERFTQVLGRSVNLRLAAIGLAAGVMLGAILALNPSATFELAKMGPAFAGVSEAARVPVLSLICGLVGAAFAGVMGGVTTNAVGNAVRPVFVQEQGKMPELQPAIGVTEERSNDCSLSKPCCADKGFAADESKFSLKDIIDNKGKPACTAGMSGRWH